MGCMRTRKLGDSRAKPEFYMDWQQPNPRTLYEKGTDPIPRMYGRVWESHTCRNNYDLWKVARDEQRRYKRKKRSLKTRPVYDAGNMMGYKSPADSVRSSPTYSGISVRQPYYRSYPHTPHIHQLPSPSHQLSAYRHPQIPYEIPLPRTHGDHRLMTNYDERVVKAQYLGNQYYASMPDLRVANLAGGRSSQHSSYRDLPVSPGKSYASRSSNGKRKSTYSLHKVDPGDGSESPSSTDDFDKLILKSIMDTECSAESKKPSKTSMGDNDMSKSAVKKKRNSTNKDDGSSGSLDLKKTENPDLSSSKIEGVNVEEYNPFGVDLSDTEEEGVTLGRVILGDSKTKGVDLAAALVEHLKGKHQSKESPRLILQFG